MPLGKLRRQSRKEIIEIAIFRIEFKIDIVAIAQEV